MVYLWCLGPPDLALSHDSLINKKDDSMNEHAHNCTLNIRMPIHHIPPPLTHNYTFMHFNNSQYVCSLSSSGGACLTRVDLRKVIGGTGATS